MMGAVASTMLLAVSTTAQATLFMSFKFNGMAGPTCMDEQVGCDAAIGDPGFLVFLPLAGTTANWSGLLFSGKSFPKLGSAIIPMLNLSVIADAGPKMGGGTLEVTLTETGFMLPIGNISASSTVGGSWPSPVTYASFLNGAPLTNAAFPFLPPGSSQAGSAIGVAAGYSLKVTTLLTSNALDDSDGSVDTTLNVIPEPGTLALFGLGLVGLGFARRKKAA